MSPSAEAPGPAGQRAGAGTEELLSDVATASGGQVAAVPWEPMRGSGRPMTSGEVWGGAVRSRQGTATRSLAGSGPVLQ